MRNSYEAPEVQIVMFDTEDVMAWSNTVNDNTGHWTPWF